MMGPAGAAAGGRAHLVMAPRSGIAAAMAMRLAMARRTAPDGLTNRADVPRAGDMLQTVPAYLSRGTPHKRQAGHQHGRGGRGADRPCAARRQPARASKIRPPNLPTPFRDGLTWDRTRKPAHSSTAPRKAAASPRRAVGKPRKRVRGTARDDQQGPTRRHPAVRCLASVSICEVPRTGLGKREVETADVEGAKTETHVVTWLNIERFRGMGARTGAATRVFP